MRRFRKGFTLVELMVVIAVLAILLTIVTLTAAGALKDARVRRADAMRVALEQGLNAYYAQTGEWPATIENKINSMTGDSYAFTPGECDTIFREVVGKAYGKGKGTQSMLLDATALFVCRASRVDDWGCNDQHKYPENGNYCGNRKCASGVDFSVAVAPGSKHAVPLAQMAFGYPTALENRFHRYRVTYHSKTDSVTVSK